MAPREDLVRPDRGERAVITDHVDVLGQPFTIAFEVHPTAVLDPDAPQSHDALGVCNRTTQRIVIRAGLTPAKTRETLLHEVIHAIIGTSRIDPFDAPDDAEETLVSQLAPLLLMTLRANPHLIKALVGDVA